MGEYKVTVAPHERIKDTREITVSAPSIWEAMEETIWEMNDRFWILAVDTVEGWSGEWALSDTRFSDGSTYPSKADAIAHGDNGMDVFVAVPRFPR